MEQFFHVGTITSPHGVRGEVKVYPTTDDPERFLDLKQVILRKKENDPGETRGIRKVHFLKNMVLLHLDGVEDRNAAELLRGLELYVPREDAVPLQEDEYFIADLIGMKVFSDGEEFGVLKDVLQTGANDVYAVMSPRFGEVLIPAIKPCIINVDIVEGRMDVHLLPGLIDESEKKK